MNRPCPQRVRRTVEYLQMFRPEQFHGHGSHLAKLNGCLAIERQILLPTGQCMKGMTGLVEHGLQIALKAD